jgi:hypothetical protein
MPGWSQRPLFKNPHNMMGGGFVGMPKGIPGYEQGSVVEEMPAYRQEQLAKEAEYQKEIEKTAGLFLNPFQGLLKDYEWNLNWYAKNIAGGHQVPKEQVMQDIRKAVVAQREERKVKKLGRTHRSYSGIDEASPTSKDMLAADEFETVPKLMERIQEKMSGLDSLGNAEDINFAPTGLASGGIVRLQTGGMAPELFEGEEIVETNPMINAMAAQGGPGIASVSAAPAPEAMPERNVPNERGIIELAMDAEEVEDDEPIVAMAKQEAQGRLDEEFNVLRSTAKAEEATGNSPSFIIKSSMDDLARSARRIENEITEKYPEVPADANLISSDDLIPYREELVAIFQVPEVGSEEPLMDTAVMAKNGGLIPGYQKGSVVPEDVSWIDEDILKAAKNLNEAEKLMVKRYGPDITAMRKLYSVEKDPRTISKREEEERNLPIDELLEQRRMQGQDTRIADLITAMEGSGFMGATKPETISIPSEPGARGQTMTAPMSPSYIRDNLELIKQYQASQEEFSPPIEEIEVTAQKKGLPEGQGSVDQGLSFQDTGQDLAAIVKAGKDAGMSNAEIMELIKLMQQGDPLAGVKGQAETLKGTIKADLEGITSILDKSIGQYEKDAKKQDKNMRNIFDDIEKRIPEQAKYQALTSPASGGMGSQYWGRKFKRGEIEQNLFQENNRNKIEFENLRKQETEARRKQDLDALYEIKLKQAEILSGIDESILSDERAIAKAKIENELAMDLERLKIELGGADPSSSRPAAIWADLLKSRGKDTVSKEDAIETMMTGGDANAQYILDQGVLGPGLEGTKTIKGKEMNFIELYRSLIGTTFIDRSGNNKKHTSRTIVEAWRGV